MIFPYVILVKSYLLQSWQATKINVLCQAVVIIRQLMEGQKLIITKSLDINLLIATAYECGQLAAQHQTVGTCDDYLCVRLLTVAAHRALKLRYVLYFVHEDIVGLSLHTMPVNKGVQIVIVSDVVKFLLLLIHIDDVGRTVLSLFIFQLPKQIAFANTPLADKDDDDVLSQCLLYLVKIRLSDNVLHIFYN